MHENQTKITVFSGLLKQRPLPPPGADQALHHKPTLTMNYAILAQSRQDLEDRDNSPNISMWPYLLASAKTQQLNEISIYSASGRTPEEMRFLYMNALALAIWGEMNRACHIIGQLHRPPRTAVLAFGMPFSE